MKAAVLKNFEYSQKSCRPATLLKRDFPLNIAKRTPIWRTSANGCFWHFKTATEHWWEHYITLFYQVQIIY